MILTVVALAAILSPQPRTQPKPQAAQVRPKPEVPKVRLKPDTTSDADIVRSIEAQGGRIVRDQSGRIVESRSRARGRRTPTSSAWPGSRA